MVTVILYYIYSVNLFVVNLAVFVWFLLPNHLDEPYWLVPPFRELVTASTSPVLVQLAFFVDYWPLRTGPVGFPETSVSNYHHSLRNNPEEHSSFCFCAGTMLLLLILFFHIVPYAFIPTDGCGAYLSL